MASTPQPSPLADLPPDVLGRVIALLPLPADRARFRAVCRSWRSALRQHAGTQLPWILHADGTIVTLPYHDLHSWSPFPDGTKLIGATNSWLALYRADASDGRRRYLLHNPFSNTTVPLPALDLVIGKVPDQFAVRKVLMRSTGDDLVAVMTNMRNYRIILCRPRKSGAWLLKRRVLPYASISDIAFHGDNLYGVTKNAGLIALELAEKKDGRPTVKSAKYVITHFESDDEWDDTEDEEEVSSSEGDVSSSKGDEEVEPRDASGLENEDALEYNETSVAEDEDNELGSDERSSVQEEDTDLESDQMSSSEDENEQLESTETSSDEDSNNNEEVGDNLNDVDLDGYCTNPDITEENEFMDYTVTRSCLLESGGKLLMVRWQQYMPCLSTRLSRDIRDNYKVDDDSDLDILEADLHVGSWVPAATTCMLFVGDHFSTSIFGCKEASEEFICHFVYENDVKTIPKTYEELLESQSMWYCPQGIVI
ncbi:hypothetical protein QYE76_071522 [Lolium multiflorum]|uniref:F-box domain-containing protein n=1 Tax=Lolium multiflorum TaxID=4521 RepID=A0AAD8WGW9_LOLMU|nr:hypothetical protein QYE76_071522 [Lolium multiflorum]